MIKLLLTKVDLNNEVPVEYSRILDEESQVNNAGLKPTGELLLHLLLNSKSDDSRIKVQTNTSENLEEIEFHLEELTDKEPITIKKRDNIYYEMYKEARRKAKIARDLALSAYLEAKRIKNTYMLDDLNDEEDEYYDSEEEDDDDDDSDEEDEKDEKEIIENVEEKQ